MSVSQLPAQVQDNWTLISSSTPTSGTVVSFTSIATNWRKLWLVTDGPITVSASGYYPITINSITTTNAYRYFRYISTGHSFADEPGLYGQQTGTLYNFDLIFDNPNSNAPFVQFDGFLATSGSAAQRIDGYVLSATTQITRIDITLDPGNYTTNTGTIYLYGTV